MVPEIRSKKPTTEGKSVYLENQMWKDLDQIAEFAEATFTALGEPEKVSRNAVITEFLDWAVKSYWDDKGGRPTGEKDLAEKIAAHAKRLKAEAKAKK